MSSRLAGGCVLVILGGGAIAILTAVAPEVAILSVWGFGFGVLLRVVTRPNSKIDIPSPPPPEAPDENEKPQFSVVEDPNNPHRHVVVWDDERTT